MINFIMYICVKWKNLQYDIIMVINLAHLSCSICTARDKYSRINIRQKPMETFTRFPERLEL